MVERWYQKREVKMAAIIVAIVIILFLFWANFFYKKTCDTRSCFNEYLEDCKPSIFTNINVNASFEYEIIGKKDTNCQVNVKFLGGQLYDSDLAALSNKEMSCYVPFGVVTSPESNIENCHGILKEELQKLIITKMHKYIIQNLGKINSDLLNAI